MGAYNESIDRICVNEFCEILYAELTHLLPMHPFSTP